MIKQSLEQKRNRLRALLERLAKDRDAVACAFSGGVDSSFLLLEAVETLGSERVVAVTAISPTIPPGEMEDAEDFCNRLGVRHVKVETKELDDKTFASNPVNRCYVCKRLRYKLLKEWADENNYQILDGTQADDDPNERPGMAALTELGVQTPLAEAGIGKADIREFLGSYGFHKLAEKSAQPCLATRIPFGTSITVEALEMISSGEKILRSFGFETVRLRRHYPLARIVLDKEGINRILSNSQLREEILEALLRLGYSHVTLDLKEYGS